MEARDGCKDEPLNLNWIRTKGRLRMVTDDLSESGQETDCTCKRGNLVRV